MNESIKMTNEELAEVRVLQEKFQQKQLQLGQLYFQKIKTEQSIKEQEIKLTNEWDVLQKMENELIDKILKKYGEGSLDINSGTFIPENSPEKKATP